MTRSTANVIAELGRRQVHVRQYLGERRYEVWADGERKGKFTAPIDAESYIRRLVGITAEEGVAVEEALERQWSTS